MVLNKTTKYTFQIMSFMAKDETKLYTANYINKSLDIPFRYLRKQLTLLSKTGLLESVQGKNGGYKFSEDISNIFLMDIINTTEKSGLNDDCFFGYQNCKLKKKCIIHNKWISVKNTIKEFLQSTSLKDIKDSGPHNFLLNNNLIFT